MSNAATERLRISFRVSFCMEIETSPEAKNAERREAADRALSQLIDDDGGMNVPGIPHARLYPVRDAAGQLEDFETICVVSS